MNSQISAFARVLEPLLRQQVLPREVVGDLDDLLGTIDKLRQMLTDVAQAEGTSGEELQARLFRIQIIIEQDLPMVISDLLPPLQRLSGEILASAAVDRAEEE